MQIKTPPPLPSVVKREDKMETLRTFISAFWLMPRLDMASTQITLIARSAESPVARALVALGPDIARRSLSVRAIFGHIEPEKTPAGWSVSGPQIAFERDLRWAKNPRLADAHEQLVLGPNTCWIGDCLRRDPSRRDAYEQFVNADMRTASYMTTSFERLWAASVPLVVRAASGGASVARPQSMQDADLPPLPPRDDNSGPLASSPH